MRRATHLARVGSQYPGSRRNRVIKGRDNDNQDDRVEACRKGKMSRAAEMDVEQGYIRQTASATEAGCLGGSQQRATFRKRGGLRVTVRQEGHNNKMNEQMMGRIRMTRTRRKRRGDVDEKCTKHQRWLPKLRRSAFALGPEMASLESFELAGTRSDPSGRGKHFLQSRRREDHETMTVKLIKLHITTSEIPSRSTASCSCPSHNWHLKFPREYVALDSW